MEVSGSRNMVNFSDLHLVILDIDGVIYYNDLAVPGASQAIQALRERGLIVKFLTNDAVSSRSSRANELNSLGFEVTPSDIYTPASLATTTIKLAGNPPTMLLCGGEIREDFSEVPLVDRNPKIVVVGDNFASYGFEKLNSAFLAIINGARFIALQRNRYCTSAFGPVIDAGFWIAGLEYCTGKQAEVLGKPSIESYLTICRDTKAQPARAVMVSDDAIMDLVGAKEAGLSTVHVTEYTAKTHFVSALAPDLVVSNVAEFVEIICRS